MVEWAFRSGRFQVYPVFGGKGNARPAVDDIKDTLDRLETRFSEVKRQYDLFFQGGRRTEPVEERRALENAVRRLGQRKIVNTSDQFRFSGIQGRFYAFLNLWTRTVRDLEEGRLARDHGGTVVRPSVPGAEEAEASHIESVLEEIRAARRSCGLPAGDEDIAVIREALRERAREISERSGGKSVEFRVTVEDGKPKVKAVAR